MIPRFTAEQALRPAHRSYRTHGAFPPSGPVQAAFEGGPASGVYAGTFCLEHVLTVMTVDIDENGKVIQPHFGDEIGSC